MNTVSAQKNFQCPPVDARLLAHLKQVFPIRYPHADVEDRNIWIGRGVLNVIEYLEREFQYQTKDVRF